MYKISLNPYLHTTVQKETHLLDQNTVSSLARPSPILERRFGLSCRQLLDKFKFRNSGLSEPIN